MTDEERFEAAQEYVRRGPLVDVTEFLSWASGVIEIRAEYQGGRKRRKDAGKPRNGTLELKEPQ